MMDEAASPSGNQAGAFASAPAAPALSAKPRRARVAEASIEEAPAAQAAQDGGERERDYLGGFLEHKPQALGPGEPGGALYERVIDALREIFDPEIPVNIYDLGLIYGVDISGEADVVVTMTLTTPHCPVAETMPGEVEMRVLGVAGVRDAQVEITWDPPWDPSKMSDEARLELGML